MVLPMVFRKSASQRTFITVALLFVGLVQWGEAAEANGRKKNEGEPFQTVFPFTKLGSQWWVAAYDHPATWFQTAWRETSVSFGEAGVRFDLAPTTEEDLVSAELMEGDDGTLTAAGKTSKKFISGQLQRRKWYGYGRYEVVMRPARGEGLISAFYVYTGPHFGDTHEEIDIEFLGRDPNKIYLNRFRDGKSLEDPVWKDLGFDATETAQLYAFEWSKDSITWYADDTVLFKLTGADEVPLPPAKIYLDLWAGGPGQIDWAGKAADTISGQALVQCVSYSPPDVKTPQCSDLAAKE
jgi:endo-1,3-1,4-beta-glycanase ExoK